MDVESNCEWPMSTLGARRNARNVAFYTRFLLRARHAKRTLKHQGPFHHNRHRLKTLPMMMRLKTAGLAVGS